MKYRSTIGQWLGAAAIVAGSCALAPAHGGGMTGDATVDEMLTQAGVAVLQQLIVISRDEALANGVQEMPADIRRKLSGFIAEPVLKAARYRVQGGGDLSLQANAIRYGDALAITLDYVIVFKQGDDALSNLSMWVHELTHIEQYQRWGIRDFATRYISDPDGVEQEAYAAEARYVAQVSTGAGSTPSP